MEFTERDGRKGPPAGDKTGRNRKRTPQSEATQRKAKPKQKRQTHTWGAKHGSIKSAEGRARTGKTTHWSPASGSRRDIRARPTQGRVAPAQGNAKLPERPRDESGSREAKPTSLPRLVSQVAEQHQGRSPQHR
jgi:hypothetical protein